jgi:hypothetical protein
MISTDTPRSCRPTPVQSATGHARSAVHGGGAQTAMIGIRPP